MDFGLLVDFADMAPLLTYIFLDIYPIFSNSLKNETAAD